MNKNDKGKPLKKYSLSITLKQYSRTSSLTLAT